MKQLTDEQRALLREPNYGVATTLRPDGSPHSTVVWVDVDDDGVPTFNTARGRVKDKNLQRNPRIAMSIQDPDNPYRYLQIRARVVEVTEKGADEHIDALAKKYTGQDRYAHRRPGEVRITVKVMPEKIQSMG